MARASSNAELCQGHTLCNMAAPDVFQLRDEDGHAYVVVDELTPEQVTHGPQGRARLPRTRHHRRGVARRAPRLRRCYVLFTYVPRILVGQRALARMISV